MVHVQLELHHNGPPNFSSSAESTDAIHIIKTVSGPSLQPVSNESWPPRCVRGCQIGLPCHLLTSNQLLSFFSMKK